MNILWNYINKTAYSKENKVRLFTAVMIVISLFIGVFIWSLLNKVISNKDWVMFVVGCPVVGLGMFGSAVYLLIREFK